jgi:hypothetical protein
VVYITLADKTGRRVSLMDTRARFLSILVVVATLIAVSSVAVAGEPGQSGLRESDSGNAAVVSKAALESRGVPGQPYGVAVTPAVYLVNFLLLYMANPQEAANMPAYRAIIPSPLYDCLKEHPKGCPYADFERLFDNGIVNGGGCFWPDECQENPRWEVLAPPIARNPEQINEPLGTNRAERLARLLGIDKEMILTEAEYQCTVGTPPRNQNQQTIFQCIKNLTNSKGNTDTPLSSYGLSITEQRLVQSVCAPQAPCLVFNQLFAGPLEKIAAECGWALKLERMVQDTPFLAVVDDGNKCQHNAEPVCLVQPVCMSARPAR